MKKPIQYACCALAATLLAGSAHAQFTYTGGTLNSTQTYDGLGVDSALNPDTIGGPGNLGDDYMGSGGTGLLTVLSGTLTINDDDLKIAASGGHGTLIVGANATLNVNNIGQWNGGIDNYAGAHGTLILSNNATLNWYFAGTQQQGLVCGSGGGDVGIIDLYGGALNLSVSSPIIDDNAGFWVGNSGGTGAINLNSGAISNSMPLPFLLGGNESGILSEPITVSPSGTVCTLNISTGQ